MTSRGDAKQRENGAPHYVVSSDVKLLVAQHHTSFEEFEVLGTMASIFWLTIDDIVTCFSNRQ